jgi:dsDNA-specific endonuclease/ATPase MutS2
MDFKIGDRVSFLNEKGGGVVVSIKDKQTVVVSEDDGFSTPYSIKQLVKINSVVSNVVKDIQIPTLSQSEKQISLLFVPKNNTDLMNTDLDMQLINNSGNNFYFEIYQLEANKVLLFSSGQLADGMNHIVKSIKREEIEGFSSLRFQALFNSQKKMEPMYPLVQLVNIKASRFYKESSFAFSSFVNNVALAYTLATAQDIEQLKHQPFDESAIIIDKDFKVKEKKSIPNNYLRKDIEVDLHISEILEDQMGMSAMQMLQIQLGLFKKELEKAIQQNYGSITFIHGIGKGVLKETILKELSAYQGIKHYPANYQKYGNGATKVEIL